MTTFQTNPDTGLPIEPAAQGTFTPPVAPVDPQTPPVVTTPPTLSTEELAALQKRDTNAQSHIATLEAEAATRKAELDSLQAKLDQAADVTELLRQQENNGTTVDVDDIVTRATEALSAKQDADTALQLQKTNFDAVANVLAEKYGADKVDEAVQVACEENGMAFADMVQLAKSNPKAAMKLCDVKVQTPAQPSLGSINPSAILGQGQQQQTQKVNVMELRTDRDRVEDFERRMKLHLNK